MSSMLKKLLKFKIPNLAGLLSLIFVLGGWVWAFLALRNISQPLILHFSGQTGIDQTGFEGDLARVGIFGLVVVAINFLIAVELEARDRFLARVTSGVTLFLGLLIFIYFVAIISVN